MNRILMRGNEAIAEAAIRSGLRCYFCYPITPQGELVEYMAKELPKRGGVFLQAESEVAAINMVYGAAAAGVRTMTSSSSPGISLKQEGISYIAMARLPCVIVNMMRGGPGLGNIAPAQGDYFQATKGGGHGDYHLLVLAPSSVPEAATLVRLAFDLSDKYRVPAMILADGMIGQMMEPVELPEPIDPGEIPPRPWAVTGAAGRPRNVVSSFELEPEGLREMNFVLQETYRKIERDEVRWEEVATEDAELLLVAYGTMGRIAKTVVRLAREEGLPVGLLRPITLWPFPYEPIRRLAERVATVLTVELSAGQMWEDVRLAVEGRAETPFFGELGGVVPSPKRILEEVRKYAR
ncbi:3-methyl-2-oxobutanoate dehydrogenase subunit VorB [Candidatus Bipolaricaulota sp. J31]